MVSLSLGAALSFHLTLGERQSVRLGYLHSYGEQWGIVEVQLGRAGGEATIGRVDAIQAAVHGRASRTSSVAYTDFHLKPEHVARACLRATRAPVRVSCTFNLKLVYGSKFELVHASAC